jgi:ATP-dependent helicase HepA
MDNDLNKLLQKTAMFLARYLEDILPSLNEDWWKQSVVNNLSFQQRRWVEQRKINSMASLDFAALLRVFDQNWYQISTKLNLTYEDRHFVKEMQTVRNRWAHASAEGYSVEDTYRDLDTLQRFALVINADKDFLEEVRSTKVSLITRETSITGVNEQEQGQKIITANFELGQIVFLKSNPDIRGAVVSILPGNPENRIKVFVDNTTQTYYGSQLQAEDQQIEIFQFVTLDQFHAHLTALQIHYPGLSTLYSLNAARIDFIPYQFRPVLKFIRSDRPRLLIADGVGVGKTIEAGLILRELQARRDVRSVLIICPRPLVTESKWKNEMKRFEESFVHLNGSNLRICINDMDKDGVWPDRYQRVIVPYSLFDEILLTGTDVSRKKIRKGLLDLDPPPRFDLVIVDEAHHIRNQDTFRHQAVKYFCDNAEAVVFLTATPIQLGSQDLFVLLNALRPDLIMGRESFEHMAEPNPFIHKAVMLARLQKPEWIKQTIEALDEAAATPWGQAILRNNPEFIRIRSLIGKGYVSLEDRVRLITDLESLHTFSGIINRTRRRDIGDFTVRKPETVMVNFTPDQKQLHDDILEIQAEIFSQLHGDVNVKFMMTTIRRQAASCLYGLVPLLEDILNRHLDELYWSETDNMGPSPNTEAFTPIESRIQIILERARALDLNDPKLEALRRIIQDKQNLSNNKLMLFSSFRHTLHYLYKHLLADGFRVGMVHGGTPDDERIEFRNRFEAQSDQQDALDILLFSEIGCEGLDYQFCDCIINYDLPWNPMRVEQRIGRIDRNGQKSEAIAIYNLITPGTVDADIYERCLVRIGVFNHALGAGEEILGEITMEIRDIAENYALSEDERKLKLDQLADNKIRLIQEQEVLEQRQLELFGIRLPEDQMRKDIEDASSYWLESLSLQRLVTLYLQQTFGADQDFILGEKMLKTLRLSQVARNRLLRDFQKLPRKNNSMHREWENWLKGDNPYLAITFESACASQNPKAAFIMPLHPLVRQAANSVDLRRPVYTTLKTESQEIPAGQYKFAIYQWRFHGIREDLVLFPVSTSAEITPHLIQLFEKAEEVQPRDGDVTDSFGSESLDARHHKLWSEACSEHRTQTQNLADYQKESLAKSHRARITLVNEQLKKTDNEKIQKMRQSQLATAEADYARRVQALDIAIERADITAEAVAYGVVIVERCA